MRNNRDEMKVEQGKRLSRVLKETHTNGKDLGAVIGRKLSPQQVSAMRNGRAGMVKRTAELIHAKWPVYSIAWLMGEGQFEYRNDDELEKAKRHQFVADYAQAFDGVELIANACDYNIVPCGDGRFILATYKQVTHVDGEEMSALVNEIRDYVDFKLSRMPRPLRTRAIRFQEAEQWNTLNRSWTTS